jgi:hypothetical protein
MPGSERTGAVGAAWVTGDGGGAVLDGSARLEVSTVINSMLVPRLKATQELRHLDFAPS